ncbi:hypothetical protein [Pseudoalteromonas denitrificans]|uniref:Uncharacterized protein n=1 Tax=Pseudoalteromonas denitrificans DSM 6059 TaxID=1123010 RepID=A0A1I1UNG7_9GAMM|nr:hypothetical protein [Pseudoalteromonas denitrificans]SFD72336.1 hypothetical protein SAMN02745724_05288 [Pseudoalteromonas denitrificans DSM 6059]
MNKVFVFLIFNFLFFSMESNAVGSNVKSICESCDSLFSFQREADRLTKRQLGTHKVLIVSLNNEKSYNFVLERTSFNNGEFWEFVVKTRQIAVPPEDKNKIDNAITAKQDAIQAIASNPHTVPVELADGVWDLVGRGWKQTAVGDNYLTTQGVGSKIYNYLTLAGAVTGKISSSVELGVTLYFSNGSKAFFKISGVDNNGNVQLSFRDGKDAEGNNVKDSKTTFYQGQYNFSKNGLKDFIDAAKRYGINITQGGSPAGSGTGSISCDNANVNCQVLIQH